MTALRPRLRRQGFIALAVLAGLLAVAMPIVASLYLAMRQGRDEEFAHLEALAGEVLRRSEATRVQIADMARALRAHTDDPCSEAAIARMRQVDAASTYFQAVGYVRGTRLMCSSLGSHGEGVELGVAPPPRGSGIRTWAQIPLSVMPGFVVNVYQRDGAFAAIVHPDLVLDVVSQKEDVRLALMALEPQQVVRSRGVIDVDWLAEPVLERRYSDDGFLVVVRRGPSGYTAALAARPDTAVRERVLAMARWVVPVGLCAGLLLAAAVYVVARQMASMATQLRGALRRGELFLQYQPVVDLASGRCVGAEALLRWRRADGGLVRPDIFIPVAEESGLIGQVTRRVLELLAHEAAPLLRRHPRLHIGVNLASADLESAATPGLLRDWLQRSGLPPSSLMVEATERGFLRAEVARAVVTAVRALGIRVAIDDFGTGYSSLSYLQSFEIDCLKIDKSFVDTLGTEAATSHVAQHIIAMSRSLRLQTIAEGVETEAQARALRAQGVERAQGWLFGRPMDLPAFEALVLAQEARGVEALAGA